MADFHPVLNVIRSQTPIYFPENQIDFQSKYAQVQLNYHNINKKNQISQQLHSEELNTRDIPISFYNYQNFPHGKPTTPNYSIPASYSEKYPLFQGMNQDQQTSNDQYSITDCQHHQLFNPSQLYPQQQMILFNSLQNSAYPTYSHMIQSQQTPQFQVYSVQAPIHTNSYCYSNITSQNNRQQPDQLILNKFACKAPLDNGLNKQSNKNQIQGIEDKQQLNYYNSKRKTLEIFKSKQNDYNDVLSSQENLCQKHEIKLQNSFLKQNDPFEKNSLVYFMNHIIKNNNEAENKPKKFYKSCDDNQKNQELSLSTQPKQQEINELESQYNQTDNEFYKSQNQQKEQLLKQQSQQYTNDEEDQRDFINKSKLNQIQCSEKQTTCGFRKRSNNGAHIEVESTICQFTQFKDTSIKIENDFLNKNQKNENQFDEKKIQSPLVIHHKQTLSKLDKCILKKRKLCQTNSLQLQNKLIYNLKIESNHESLISQNSTQKKKTTIQTQQEQKQTLNLFHTSVIKYQQKLEENLFASNDINNQNGQIQEQISNNNNSSAALSDEIILETKKKQMPNFFYKNISFKNKKEKKHDQKQKKEILKQIENDDGFFDEYENEELWEDSFFHHMKQNSRSGGKSFFLVSNYKKRLFKQLDENDQSVILSMKKSKKFNFSKNVIKHFLKVVNSQINYVYIRDENSNNQSDLQTLIDYKEQIYNNIKYNTEQVQKVTQQNESLNFDQEILLKHCQQDYKKNQEKQKNNQFDQQSLKKEVNFDRSKYRQIQNPSESLLNELRQKLKKYLISTSYTHFSLKKIISHNYYSLYFNDFLENYSDEWLQSGKTKYKNEQKIMIHFLKLCFSNRKLLIFLSQHDPLQNKDSFQNK
ncbi:hypothetical protein ABPG72_017416 [Tetrahymena utriculariae]